MGKPWIGIDLDGTLAKHESGEDWDGISIGEPVSDMIRLVRDFLADEICVKIMTARVSHASVGSNGHKSVDEQIEAITNWCIEHIGCSLPVTCEKDYDMVCLIDDRAIGVRRNEAKPRSELQDFSFLNECVAYCSSWKRSCEQRAS